MKWTQRQQEVIDARGCNLLVSAAAGSGKTAVLVERIIGLICDEENPVDIDRLLVMTFTNAAAAQMRERIAQAIDRKLEEEPGREHLQVQAALVHRAQITTIDSFCLSLIRDHFNLLDLDPAFRIGDEGELMLLRADVMEAMLEEYYQKDDPVFGAFVETYATGKSDSGIEDYIMQVHTFSQSSPFPGEWIEACRQELWGMEEGNLAETAWMAFLMEDVRRQAGELAGQLEAAMDVCQEEGGPHMYLPALQADLETVRGIGTAEDYGTLYDRLQAASFKRMAAARGKDIDPAKKEYASASRDRVKKAVKGLKEMYGQSLEEAVEHMAGARDASLKLLELAEEFHRRYQEIKKDKNIVDFNDLEHEALRILVEKEDGKLCFTDVADELSGRYAEILVDEYQDSNDVQEMLIRSLSAERFGRPNVFMVGDVKQSIYKFRLARPELFMRKYERYEEYGADGSGCEAKGERDDKMTAPCGRAPKDRTGDREAASGENGKKIELRQNFRSRASVLDSINALFFQIMTRELGGIEYSEKIALHPGAVFEETKDRAGTPTELLMADTGTKVLGPADEELEEYTSREIEARMIASSIRDMMNPEKGLSVWDSERGGYRRVQYGDIVILLRSLTGWTDSFLNVLTQEDIPAFAETGTGYFNTIEVETVLAMLAVIDNPIQDIPLAAVLKSPMVGMDDEDMAWLMAVWKQRAKKGQDRGIYGALRLALLGEEQEMWQEGDEWEKQETWQEQKWEEGENDSPEQDTEWEDNEKNTDIKDIKWENIDSCIGESREKWEQIADSAGVPASTAREIHRKAAAFASLLGGLRQEAVYLPIHELIHRMYLRTGYYDYVSAMPAGEVRKANLDMLIEKASAYEKTSYRGLFHFIRYIEKLKKYDTDFGEAAGAGQSRQMVRIMSIHKSKGLEFPVVFLAGMGKNFNKQDIRGKLVIDGDLGIGTDYLNVETRVKTSTLKKNVLKRKMDLDNLGEELRVLYVAMTRAKEKLIMTGTDRYLGKKLERWQERTWDSSPIPGTILSGAGSYLDWVLMCRPWKNPLFYVEEIPVESLVGEAVARKVRKDVSEEELRSLDLSRTYDEATRQLLRQNLSYRYPHEGDIDLHTKISVSELKKQGQDIDDRNSLFQPLIPEFLKKADHGETAPEDGEKQVKEAKPEGGGAVRGSSYHRVLELLDFEAITERKDVEIWMKKACEEGRLTGDTASMVNPDKIWRFLQTSMGKRMRTAQREGRLYREQQFVMGIPAREMGLAESEELVLIQGIIDAWMEEDDGLVLVDYKTDRVSRGQEEILAQRYRVQLDYYKRALEQMVKKPVKERVIYSLTLQKEVRI